MNIVPKSGPLKGVLGVLLPPFAVIGFTLAERACNTIGWEYEDYGLGVLLLLAVVVLCSFALSVICLCRLVRTIGFGYSILLVALLASGPFWGIYIGVEPFYHGFSGLLSGLHLLLAWGLGLYLIAVTLWRLLRTSRRLRGRGPDIGETG